MIYPKNLLTFVCILICLAGCRNRNPAGFAGDQIAFNKTKAAIGDAFSKGDVTAVLSLHHPDVVKYFGGKNIVTGRSGLKKQLTDLFNYARTEFVENNIESTIYNGDAIIETSIFSMRMIPKNGDSSRIIRGRSMVVYVRYKDSPTGWASLREMVQEAPGN